MEKISVLAKKIFETHLTCRVTIGQLLMVRSTEDQLDKTQDKGVSEIDGSSFVNNSPMQEAIIHRLNGLGRLTGDAVKDEESFNQTDFHALSINEIVEIYSKTGHIELSGIKDVVKVFKILDDYRKAVDSNTKFSIHYTPPPEEDMVKIKTLVSAIERSANAYLAQQETPGNWGNILSMFSDTTIFEDNNDKTNNVGPLYSRPVTIQ